MLSLVQIGSIVVMVILQYYYTVIVVKCRGSSVECQLEYGIVLEPPSWSTK